MHNPSSGVIFSLDPGHNAGWARWHDGRLVACGLAMSDARDPNQQIAAQRQALTEAGRLPEHTTVSEMAVYRGRRGGMTPTQLARFNIVAGALGDVFYAPHEWKGVTAKAVSHPAIWAALDAEERAVVVAWATRRRLALDCPDGLAGNVLDSIGIGLHHLGRTTVDVPASLGKNVRKRGKRKCRKVKSATTAAKSSSPSGKRSSRRTPKSS